MITEASLFCRAMNEKPLIKSISYSQDEILRWILELYVPSGRFDADVTYSRGGFYKNIPRPAECFDIAPQFDFVSQADCRSLPMEDGVLQSIIIDLPFLATTGQSLNGQQGNIINRRFTVCRNEQALSELYRDAISEAFRVLGDDGILVMKCQDKVSSNKQYITHCSVFNWALETGFYPADLFILLAKSRLVANWQRNQKHARKFHAFFWVFRKKVTKCP